MSPASDLTPREQAVAALVADGLSNVEVAERLEIAPATVKVHLRRIMRKLDCANRTQVALRMHDIDPQVPDSSRAS